jgi:cyclic pyranopterin phosphate synthase
MRMIREEEPLQDLYARRIDYLRLSVTDRCNLRCTYCMPPEGVPHLPHENILTYEEILRFVGIAVKAGISKVRLTGGEPLVRKNIESLVGVLAASYPQLDLSITTNGVLLADHAPSLKRSGLRRVNISIDSLREETYARITRGGSLQKVLHGLRSALEEDLHPVKVNVVLLKGFTDKREELEPFIRLIHDLPVFVRFIEYMSPRGTLDASHFVPITWVESELKRFGKIVEGTSPVGAGPARYLEMEGALGKIGLISPISSHFCPSCNRLRLTADGRMKPCLLSSEEMDIRSQLRGDASDQEILHSIRTCLHAKRKGYRERSQTLHQTMSQIGG